MSSDPRVGKPRVPKAYSDEQLVFLRGHLSEFEKRSHGSIRGDAKKFALERANEFIVRFGLPEEFEGVEEPEPRFREQIYNWYKNTVGRARRKLEGRPRAPRKMGEKVGAALAAAQTTITWNPNLATPTTVPYAAQANNGQSIMSSSQSQHQSNMQLQCTGYQPPASISASPSNVSLNVTSGTIREALLSPAIDTATLSALIQTYALSHTSSTTPLTPVIQILFDASSASSLSSSHSVSANEAICNLLRRFLDACSYFPALLVHAGVSGPLAGPRALQMAIRKSSVWVSSVPSSGTSSMTDEMERIAADRQRRKDYIQWAQIHAAALELGIFGVQSNTAEVGYSAGHSFSELMARDAVWEQDEVEWVAGICVLRSLIRTSSVDRREGYEEMLRTYEGRWKEIKDEARQALVTDFLLGAKENLSRLAEKPRMT